MKSISARASRAPAPEEHREASAGHPRGAFEVQNAQGRANLPVRLRLERECRWLAVAPDFPVVCGAGAHRHALRAAHSAAPSALGALLLHHLELGLERLDLLRARLVRREDARRIASVALHARDLRARGVLLALQPFDVRNQGSAPAVELDERGQERLRIGAAIRAGPRAPRRGDRGRGRGRAWIKSYMIAP